MHDNLPDEPYSFVGAPIQRKEIDMNLPTLKLALIILGGALFLCLGGIIWLASQEPVHAIPDVLVGTTGLIGGAIVGVLVPTKAT